MAFRAGAEIAAQTLSWRDGAKDPLSATFSLVQQYQGPDEQAAVNVSQLVTQLVAHHLTPTAILPWAGYKNAVKSAHHELGLSLLG